jgi:DNA modification methylase
MSEVEDDSVHLIVTSPPYFDAKKYSDLDDDLGNCETPEDWRLLIKEVWRECLRVLAPGRKMFINIMNLPRSEGNSFHALNLVGWTTDDCIDLGLVFKRDIIWEKTNAVQSPVGSYPWPVGLVINNMHESILEFEKPGHRNYSHLTQEHKDLSEMDKQTWLSMKKSDVWKMRPYPSGKVRNHPAPFPDELVRRLIIGYSYVSETVLDPFLGTGATLKMALKLGRRCIGYEINPEFESLIKESIRKGGEDDVVEVEMDLSDFLDP